MSAACGAGTEKQRGTRVRPGAPADGRPTTPSLRDCLWTPATNAWPVTSVWAHGGASTAAVNHTNLAYVARTFGDKCHELVPNDARAKSMMKGSVTYWYVFPQQSLGFAIMKEKQS